MIDENIKTKKQERIKLAQSSGKNEKDIKYIIDHVKRMEQHITILQAFSKKTMYVDNKKDKDSFLEFLNGVTEKIDKEGKKLKELVEEIEIDTLRN